MRADRRSPPVEPRRTLRYLEASLSSWSAGVSRADAHAPRVSRAAPFDLRATGTSSWPFVRPRRPRATPCCRTGRCVR